MKRCFTVPLVALAIFGLTAAFATTAQATPSKTSRCNGCHSGVNVPVTATLVSSTAASTTYRLSSPTAYAMAVFDASTRIYIVQATTGQFSVANGKTYTVFAVRGPSDNTGIGSTSVTPAAPATDVTPPVTTSNAKATYVASAVIALTASDAGGIAATYYKKDGGAQTTGTSATFNTVGSHTLEFWSVDVKGNIEAHKTVSFTITAPLPDTTAPTTASNVIPTFYNMAMIRLTATDNAGGSGIANTYYIVDSATQAAGTAFTVSGFGSHTIQFWSVDAKGNTEARKTASFEIVERLMPPTPIYRFFNMATGSHFYTASESERDTVMAMQRSTYRLDGMAFSVNSLNPDNNAPLYRFFNKVNGSHFYTASAAEKARVEDEFEDTYSYDGPAYNVCSTPVAGAITVWRFYNKTNGSHFYTTSAAEKASVQANLKATYSLDGAAYYLAP